MEEPVSGFLYPGIYYKNTVFTLWERLPAAINDGSAVLLRYSRLEAAPTRVDNPVKQKNYRCSIYYQLVNV
jgi:hypothetical protein